MARYGSGPCGAQLMCGCSEALRAQRIRTAGPRPKQVLGYLVGPLAEARRDRAGSWRSFGLTGEASPPYSSTPYATGDGEARRSGIVQGRQCDWAPIGSRCSGVIGAPSVLCGWALPRVSLAAMSAGTGVGGGAQRGRRLLGSSRVRQLGNTTERITVYVKPGKPRKFPAPYNS